MFGKKTPETQARDELEDLERELFILRKNMQHDRHRLAYIKARKRQLQAEHPSATRDPARTPATVRWIGRRPKDADQPQLDATTPALLTGRAS